MRPDRGIRVMLERDCVPGRQVWAPEGGQWVAAEIIKYWGNDRVTLSVVKECECFAWDVNRYVLRFRDPAKQGRDLPRDRAEAPALKPKLKPGEVAKLGILSNGDIIGGQA